MTVREEIRRAERNRSYANDASVEPRDRVQTSGVVVSICFIIAALVLFNAYPQWVGVLVSGDDPATFVPLLTPEFFRHLPWINAWWGLALTLNFLHLGLRRWTLATRWLDLALSLFGMSILWRLIHSGPIVAYHPELVRLGEPLEPLLRLVPTLVPSVSGLVQAFLWVALVFTGLGALRKLFTTLFR